MIDNGSTRVTMSFKEAVGREACRLLDESNIDMARLLKPLERSGGWGWYVLEQDILVETEPREGEGSIADVRKSLAYLQKQP